MSITIATPTRRFTIKTDNVESERLFNMLIVRLITEDEADNNPIPYSITDDLLERDEVAESNGVQSQRCPDADAGPNEGTEPLYKGFLYIKCRHCGQIHGFCSKHDMHYYKCPDCGEKTELTGLVPMHLNCECGRYFRYMTNMDEFAFDANCIQCGSPVSVKYNSKKNVFETIM